MKIDIPVVIGENGAVQGWVGIDENGDHTEDIGILYDSFDMDTNVVQIRITAEVDLDELFREREIEGQVTVSPKETPQ